MALETKKSAQDMLLHLINKLDQEGYGLGDLVDDLEDYVNDLRHQEELQ